MFVSRHADDVLNINVGGKRFTVSRADLLIDPKSKLAEMFKPGRPLPTDKGGSVFLNRDGKSFRYIIAYLRFKRENVAPPIFALPSKPDDLARLAAECDALNLVELKELALYLLEKYRRSDEQHFTVSYIQSLLRDLEGWKFEQEKQIRSKGNVKKIKSLALQNSGSASDDL